jgi:transcriptional regulator with XRE-family HTH domain
MSAGAAPSRILGRMPETRAAPRTGSPIGTLLQHWRQTRHMSQLALAVEADVSPRHVSFVETGRARPSREMVMLLADALDVPLRERNALLLAAGFAPAYKETDLQAHELAPARAALEAILRQQEPFPAVVMSRHWDVVNANAAASRLFGLLLGDAARGPANVIRMMFDPALVRPCVHNWEGVAEALIRRIHREAVGGVPDAATRALLEEALAYPGVPSRWRKPSVETPLLPVIPVSFRKDAWRFDYFSTVTTLGTPQDVTLQEIRIECFFPVDAETRRQAEALALRAEP